MKIFLAECIGTLLLVLLGNGCVANVLLKGSKGKGGGWIVIATGWGLAVALAVYVCGWVSDAHINPAVTIAFAVIHKTSWSLVPFYLGGQFIGGFIGALLVYVTYYSHYQIEKSEEFKRMSFCTQPAVHQPVVNFLTECIGTFVLLFAVLGIINQHNSLSCGIAPGLIGIVVFSIGLSLGGPTGYAINPARDLAPRLAHSLIYSFEKSQWHYAWVPLFGPLFGGIFGAFCYQLIFG
ncbi:MAG: aquaporin family protein [Simkaniaceae bacterium]|nr:aquaporin family protein [Simkaniaceae bacterium]MCF7853076.1 aquaporin family protein [Simkaniaceae bacterium]